MCLCTGDCVCMGVCPCVRICAMCVFGVYDGCVRVFNSLLRSVRSVRSGRHILTDFLTVCWFPSQGAHMCLCTGDCVCMGVCPCVWMCAGVCLGCTMDACARLTLSSDPSDPSHFSYFSVCWFTSQGTHMCLCTGDCVCMYVCPCVWMCAGVCLGCTMDACARLTLLSDPSDPSHFSYFSVCWLPGYFTFVPLFSQF
jgi:hypothetical protein